jgi:dGTPase
MKATQRFFSFNDDFRDPFSRDRDRVLHSSSFRRLEYKTQVFLNHEGDYFRTRLTHSLEVSQIARSLSRELGLNETLCEAIALSHDLGHTPFGHIGGDELDRLLKQDGFESGFDHNFQSFRVLTQLEKRYKDFDGLNLTFATLEGVLKHSFPYKKNFLTQLHDDFDLTKHPSIEAMIVDRADEIAYVSHDIDDGVKYGLIDFELLLQEPLAKRVKERVKKEGFDQKDALFRHRFVANLITLLIEELIMHSRKKVAIYSSNEPLCAEIDSSEPLPIGFDEVIEKEIKVLKKFLFQNLYRHQKIATKMYSGKECIKSLYRAFSEDEHLLPKRQRGFLEHRSRHRVIADYIASMTDRYAIKTYKDIYGF